VVENNVKGLEMLRPVPILDVAVIKVGHNVLKIKSKQIHCFLGKVRGNGNAHRALLVSEKAKGSSEGSKFLGFIVKFEGIELH